MTIAVQKKLKILICGPLPPPNYGPSILYKQLLESEVWKKHEIIFLKLNYFSFNKSKLTRGLQIFKFFIDILKYTYIILFKRPNYIILSLTFEKGSFYKGAIFVFIGKIFRRKIINYDMGQYATELYKSSNQLNRKLIKCTINNLTAFIVQGLNTKMKYESLIDPKIIFELPCCVDDTIDIITPKINMNNRLDILYFSLLTESKGLWTALYAIPKVLNSHKNVTFTFVGAIDSEITQQKVMTYIKNNNLQNYFKYKGYSKDVFDRTVYFRNADVFIFPTNRDAFGLVLLHAMAEKKPVIGTYEGNISEIIKDKKNGFLIEKNNSDMLAHYIKLLITDENRRKNMGEESRKNYLTYYTPKKYSENLYSILLTIDKKFKD